MKTSRVENWKNATRAIWATGAQSFVLVMADKKEITGWGANFDNSDKLNRETVRRLKEIIDDIENTLEKK